MAGLKFRIIRHTPQAIIGMILGLTLGSVLGLAAISGILTIRLNEHRGAMLMVGGTVLLVLWFLAPLVLGGGELILDLRTLALYPFNLPTLVGGLLLAAVIGVPFLITLLVALSAVSHAGDTVTAALLAVAAGQLAITAVLAGRVSVAVVGLLTSTRFRSVAGGITVLAAISLGISAQFVTLAIERIEPEQLQQARRIVRFIPLGWTPEAMANASLGRPGASLLFLALGATLPLGLLLVWRVVLRRLLDGQVAQIKDSQKTKPLVPQWMDRIVDRQTAAVWAKSARSIRRDAREWTEIAAFLPLILAFALPTITQLQEREPRMVLLPFLAAVSGATMVSTNLFGADGPRFTADAIPGEDFRPVLIGKLMPRLLLVAAVVVAGTLVLAWVMNGWAYVPVTLLLVVQSMLLGAGAGIFVSIRSPIALPEKLGGFNASNTGCIAPLFQLGALAVADVIAIIAATPALAIALVYDPWLAVLATLPTVPAVMWLIHRRVDDESRRARERIPDMVAALTRRT